MVDSIVLASLTSAVSVLGNEYLKGIATEGGKSSWAAIKGLLGWSSDPAPAEIPEKVTAAITTSPELAEKLLQLLSPSQVGTASAVVTNVEAKGGKVVVANTIVTDRFTM